MSIYFTLIVESTENAISLLLKSAYPIGKINVLFMLHNSQICNYTSNDKNGWLNVLRAEELKEKWWQNWCCIGSDADIQQIWIQMLECGIFQDSGFTFRGLKKRYASVLQVHEQNLACI